MGKIQTHVVKRDSVQDHKHALPDGRMTSGMLMKPSTNPGFPMHTHLYELDECTYETGPEEDGPGHVHSVGLLGETSGPLRMDKEPGQAWKQDTGGDLERAEHEAALKAI